MKIIISTTFTTYVKAVQIKPTGNLWEIKNLGTSPVYIGDYLLYQLYSSFGIDTTDILLPSISSFLKGKKTYQTINDTAFNIRFGEPLQFGYGYPPYKFLLIETFFKIVK